MNALPADKLKNNGKGVGSLPGHNVAPISLVNERSGNLTKDDKDIQRVIGV